MDQNRADRAARLFLGAAAGAAVTGAAVGWYAAKVEPRQLTVSRPELCRRPPVKTLFFSDVHFGPMYSPEFLEPLVDAINTEEPELVLFGGDFFAKFARDAHMLDFSWLAGQLQRIKAPLGKYAVWGNHDVRQGAAPFYRMLMEHGGFVPLWDKIVQPAPGVTVCGLAPYSDGKVLRDMPAEGWRVCLCHMPDKARYLNLSRVDVMLSGHSHAGQLQVPVLTKMILPPGGKMFPQGLYRPQADCPAQLFVSRGIGMSGVPFRLLTPPELVVLG